MAIVTPVSTPLNPLKAALYGALTAAFAALGPPAAFYGEVSPATPPGGDYGVLGEETAVPWRTKTWYGHEVTHTLHLWSQNRDRVDAMLGAVYATLYAPGTRLALGPGWGVTLQRPDVDLVTDDADEPDWSHGLHRLRAKVRQVAA